MVSENVTKGLSPDFLPISHSQQGEEQVDNGRTIVIAYDHSSYSDATFAKGIRLGLISPKDIIHIVHIVNQKDYQNMFLPAFTSPGFSLTSTTTSSTSDYSSVWDCINENLMLELRKLLNQNGFKNVITEIIRGNPKESMTDYCKSCNPNFVICGTHGLSPIKKAFLGSMSEYYVKNIPYPVMIVKLTDQELEERKHHDSAKKAHFEELIGK
ncbi:hypothetical protein BJ944DRAFT_265522 [Cunninghamella echinulata]|nr:hypothetical protein BJ944DRAFT_265522 [Cunninghamella echinulata]